MGPWLCLEVGLYTKTETDAEGSQHVSGRQGHPHPSHPAFISHPDSSRRVPQTDLPPSQQCHKGVEGWGMHYFFFFFFSINMGLLLLDDNDLEKTIDASIYSKKALLRN